MKKAFCSADKNGKPITEEKEKEHTIYKLRYSEIKPHDAGSIGNKNFPGQEKIRWKNR